VRLELGCDEPPGNLESEDAHFTNFTNLANFADSLAERLGALIVIMRRAPVLVIVAITACATFAAANSFGAEPSPATASSNDVAIKHTTDSLAKIKQSVKQGRAVLVDVREAAETNEGFVKGARRVPLSKLRSDLDKDSFRGAVAKAIPRDKIVYTYCRSGRRSVSAAKILKDLDYDVRPLKQGYADLMEAGFPPAAKE
jgi:phage shock protein E